MVWGVCLCAEDGTTRLLTIAFIYFNWTLVDIGLVCNHNQYSFGWPYVFLDDLPAGEEPYPSVGVTVNRTAYASNYDGNCKHTEYDIQIKNCDGYFVYFLTSITGGCTSAYCFGM